MDSNNLVLLSEVKVNEKFKTEIGEFIVLEHTEEGTKVITKDLFKEDVKFGHNCDYKTSTLRELCDGEIYEAFAAVFGADNIVEHEADLTTIDYAPIAKATCEKVTSGECDKAILCCGTGIGISMAANKVKGIRAACCSDYFSAKLTRMHNDANALCMGGRVVGVGLALELVDVFLETEFEGGRHQRRIDQIMEIENS